MTSVSGATRTAAQRRATLRAIHREAERLEANILACAKARVRLADLCRNERMLEAKAFAGRAGAIEVHLESAWEILVNGERVRTGLYRWRAML